MRQKRYIKTAADLKIFSRSRIQSSGVRARKIFSKAIIILILLIGALLRFTNLNWDSYQAFHPDERNIAWAVTRI
ncbi:MAG: hypothetical protein AAB457_02600, partial [Patescibacteria group bacterium]